MGGESRLRCLTGEGLWESESESLLSEESGDDLETLFLRLDGVGSDRSSPEEESALSGEADQLPSLLLDDA